MEKINIEIHAKGEKDFDIFCRSVYRFACRVFTDNLESVSVKMEEEDD